MKLPAGFDTPVKIGQGTFGTVYRVRQKQLDRQVVIKMIAVSNKNLRNRCLQEGMTQAKLNIQCSPQIYDVFVWKDSICIVMQWIRSLNLRRCLSLNLQSNINLQIAEGILKAAKLLHEQGYVHRDIKPENILVTPSEGVFLIDFGFSSKIQNIEAESSEIRGTAGYIAPEILNRNEKIDYFRADCYALGVILNEIVGFGNRYPLLKSLIDQDPAKRPANASDAYSIWKLQMGEIDCTDFFSCIDKHIRYLFGPVLFENAGKLLKSHRNNEAYRLCLECIQEVPDFPDALNLLSTFGNNKEINRRKQLLFVTGIVVTTGVAILFYNQFKKQKQILHDSAASVSVYSQQISLDHANNEIKLNEHVEYRYHPSETPSLTAEIIINIENAGVSVYIDGKLLGKGVKGKPDIRCNLQAGTYRIAFVGSDGNLITSEKLDVLPFTQIKTGIKGY